jgi:hypothetical protein
MKHLDFKNEKGFIALISTVIISLILLAVAASAARAAFWARFDLLARENKKISAALAEACVNVALLGLSNEEKIFPLEVVIEDAKKCKIGEVGGSNPYTIIARAGWKNSYANLKVTAKLENGELEISDWREF